MPERNFAARAGRWSAAHRKKAIFGWLAFVLVAVVIGGGLGLNVIDDEDLGNGESGQADKTLADGFPDRAGEEVLVQGRNNVKSDDPRFEAAVVQVSRTLRDFDTVRDVKSPLDPGNANQFSEDQRSALVTFDLLGDEDAVEGNVEEVLAAVAQVQERHPAVLIEQFGDASVDKAVSKSFEDDLRKAETLSLPITLVILVIAFGALVAAGIPLLLAFSAVLATFGLVSIISQVAPMDESILSVMLLVGLAVGVDYSLFYIRREREERAAGRSEKASLEAAAATSGRAVLISGFTVMVAMAGMYIIGTPTFSSFATGTILVVGVAMIGSLTVLPALLSKLGDGIDKGRVPFLKRPKAEDHGEGGFWSAIVDRVLRAPWIAGGLAAGALVVIAIPAFSLHTLEPGVQGVPRDLEIMQTYDRIQEAFPGDPVPAVVAVTAPNVDSEEMRTAIARLRIKAVSTAQMLEPTTVTINPDKTVAQVDIPLVGNGTDETSDSALETLRDEVIPATIGQVPEANADVGGMTASSVDFNDLMKQRAPWVFLFVLSLAFVLLLVTFRSIVIPIKAIALNLLSVGAAYGVLVYVFQYGHFESLLNFESIGGITSFLPLFLFVLLFGLSMDYHVFILSRVREAYDAGMTTEQAVAHGIKSTAGVVTSAAIVMVFVFGIFATLSALIFKQMGVGLAVAVLIDATIIRAVLLPASMKLLGDWNWYFPKWLEWLPKVSLEPAPPEPVAEAPIKAAADGALGIETEQRDGAVRVGLTGDLDLGSAGRLRGRLEKVEAESPALLLIDIRRLRFMDSSGLREITSAVRRGRAAGRRVVLVRAHGPLDNVLEITRVDTLMETFDDPAAAGFGGAGDGN